MAIAFISIAIILIFLDPFKRDDKKSGKVFSFHVIMTTVKHMSNKYQMLIIPLTLWNGFEQAFISADFTKSFVACAKGPEFVGWTMICFGVCDTLGSYLFGFMVKHVGRVPCFLTAACLNYATIFTFLYWNPNVEQVYLLFVLPAIWGLSDAVWQTQLNGKSSLNPNIVFNAGFFIYSTFFYSSLWRSIL